MTEKEEYRGFKKKENSNNRDHSYHMVEDPENRFPEKMLKVKKKSVKGKEKSKEKKDDSWRGIREK